MKRILLSLVHITFILLSVHVQSQYALDNLIKEKTSGKRCLGLEHIRFSTDPDNTVNWIRKDGRILINALAEKGELESLLQELEQLGVDQIKVGGNLVSCYIATEKIPLLDYCSSLLSASPEELPTLNIGTVDSEARRTHFVETASKLFNVSGEGIRIGILSDSYNARGDAQTTVRNGDLPGVGNPNGFTQPVVVLDEINNLQLGTDEGRGMAELVHDIAPGAEIYFYSGLDGYLDFAEGIDALVDAGCDIIVDDLSYAEAPFFQKGLVAQAVDEAIDEGVIYITNAGNQGQSSFESDYREFTDGDNVFFDFGNNNPLQRIQIDAGKTIQLSFQWDNPSQFAGANNPLPPTDLDIFLLDPTSGQLIAGGIAENRVIGRPQEQLTYTNTTARDQLLDIIILRRNGPVPNRVKYIDLRNTIKFVDQIDGINASTIYGHHNVERAITVGAQFYFRNPEFNSTVNVLTSNQSSSKGGLTLLLDAKGNRIDPVITNKPTIVATDGVNTSSFPNPNVAFPDIDRDGQPNFVGTSAAAPHVAGIVALLLDKEYDQTPEEIEDLLIDTAEDMDNPFTNGFDEGFDDATGYGFVQADYALAMLEDKPTVYRYQLINSTTDEIVSTLRDSSVISIEVIPGALINIEALATDSGFEPGSLRFELSGTETRTSNDNDYPFSVFGDADFDFRDWEVNNGVYTLSTTAFTNRNGKGLKGNTNSIIFAIQNNTELAKVVLVNATTNQDIREVGDLDQIPLSVIENAGAVNIRAEFSSNRTATPYIEKVEFDLFGQQERVSQDLKPPYALFLDNNGDYFGWNPRPVPGEYSLDVIPSARRNGSGTEGVGGFIDFEIIDDTGAKTSTIAETSGGTILTHQNGVVRLSTTSQQNIPVRIYTIQGAKIYDSVVNNDLVKTIDLHSFGKTGVYIVQLFESDGVTIRKILVR